MAQSAYFLPYTSERKNIFTKKWDILKKVSNTIMEGKNNSQIEIYHLRKSEKKIF
jgi:hypothetical protein